MNGMRIEDWFLIGFFGLLGIGYVVLRAVLVWQRYELMKSKLDSAVANLRTGYAVTKHFTKIIASAEMTGKVQRVTITSEFSDAMYKVEKHLKETLELLEDP